MLQYNDMPSPKPRYDLDNATIHGLARGFAKAGPKGMDPILHGEGLWDVWQEQSQFPLKSLDDSERLVFQAMRVAVTQKVMELNLIDPKGVKRLY